MNNTLTAEEIQAMYTIGRRLYNKSKLNVVANDFKHGSESMFNLLWPYVGRGFHAGYNYRHYTELHGKLEDTPNEQEFIANILTELKSIADDNNPS
jgi:hypothetical protein